MIWDYIQDKIIKKIAGNKKELTENATKNIRNILDLSIKLNTYENKYKDTNKNIESVLVIFDRQYGLTNILTESYRKALGEMYGDNFKEKVKFLDFDKSNKEEILSKINNLKEKDLVVMIQTTNFRLDDFRIRLHLFSKKLKVIEHMHLNRNVEAVWDVYVNSLEYNREYYYNTAHAVKNKIDNSKKLIISSSVSEVKGGGDSVAAKSLELIVDGELEDAKLNIGDYDNMENIGGTFPIGEVFTESKEIKNMNGEVLIYALANTDFTMQMYTPFKIKIENGIVISYADNAPQDFIDIYNQVKSYETAMIREVGFGLNLAITKEKYLGDITAFERIYGMHLSMGEKHAIYKKEGLISKKTKYHVDLFPVVDKVTFINKETKLEEVIFENNKYII